MLMVSILLTSDFLDIVLTEYFNFLEDKKNLLRKEKIMMNFLSTLTEWQVIDIKDLQRGLDLYKI
jgi:hypothetical protein